MNKVMFNEYWQLAERLYSRFYDRQFEPGRRNWEDQMSYDFLKKHTSTTAKNLVAALRKQMDRDRYRIVASTSYQDEGVSKDLFRALSGLWEIQKLISSYTERGTDAFWEMLTKKMTDYQHSQILKEYACDLALTFLTEIEEEWKASQAQVA